MGSGYLIGKWGHIDKFIKFGCFFSIISVYLISLIGMDTAYWEESLIFILYGLSCGVIYQNCIMVAQRAAPPEYLSISTTITSFFNFIGGAIGVAVYGAFLQNIFPQCYRKHFPEAAPVTVNDVHQVQDGNRIYVEAIQKTYLYTIFPVSILLFISSVFIRSNKKIRKEQQQKDLSKSKEIVSVSVTVDNNSNVNNGNDNNDTNSNNNNDDNNDNDNDNNNNNNNDDNDNNNDNNRYRYNNNDKDNFIVDVEVLNTNKNDTTS